MDWGAVTVPRWGVLVAIVGTFVALGALAPTAGAAIKLLPNGKAFGYQPLAGTMSQHTFDGTFSNLDYNGGPVTPANTPSTASRKRGWAYEKSLRKSSSVRVMVSATFLSTPQISRRTGLSRPIGLPAVRTRMPRSKAPVTVYGTMISGRTGSWS